MIHAVARGFLLCRPRGDGHPHSRHACDALLEQRLIILEHLHCDAEFDRHAVCLAVVGGFGELVFDRADERERGFAPRPQFGPQSGDAAAPGVVIVRVDQLVLQGAEALPRVELVVQDDEA